MNTLLESAKKARDYRNAIDYSKICTFGIKCLDDVLHGILPKDFITIGADSGAGKSEVCLKIAIHNARLGRKIGLYFIEGGDEEAAERIKWNLMCDKYFGTKMTGINMDYRKWRMGLLKDELISKLEDSCIAENEKVFNNIITYGYEKGMSIENFTESLDYFLKPEDGWENDPFSYKHQVDLIIIDHLQYFNLANPAKELIEQGTILKKVNEISHGYKIPVILVSHLRKKEKDRGLPSQEDFYGTSNTPKMSSLAITMSSQASKDGIHFPTYFRFVKTRTKIPSNYALLCNYNLKLSNYEDKYTCHRLKGDMPIVEPTIRINTPECFCKSNFSNIVKTEEDLEWEE
jgi:hypothetical protein